VSEIARKYTERHVSTSKHTFLLSSWWTSPSSWSTQNLF